MNKRDIAAIVKVVRAEIGKQGGKARAKTLTPRRRSEIARNAARTRWGLKTEGASE